MFLGKSNNNMRTGDNKLIVKLISGSNLYGTNSENSDLDLKGVMLPSWRQVALGKIPKQFENSSTGNNNSKNTSSDVDIEIFSLHEFIRLAKEGQTIIFDMLHTPKTHIIETSEIWDDLISNRRMFYSKNINSFIGYCRSQVIKYSVKGDRLNDAKAVLEWVDDEICKRDANYFRLNSCDLSTFPKGENINWIKSDNENIPDMIEVCNRKILLNSTLVYAREILATVIKKYGKRSEQSAFDGGVDLKALYHAFRVAYQAKELFEFETITFPRPEKEFLLDIRNGKYNYFELSIKLDELIYEVEEIRNKSNLPNNPDYDAVDNWLISIIENYIVMKG